MDSYRTANRDLWDQWTAVHQRSAFYDLDAFRAGACSLQAIERAALGDVAGQRLLHLQCHFGLDTLSWARRGAEVTGVDFSPAAIALAQQLSHELDLPARFLCTDLYALPQHLSEDAPFDLVFTSYGVLTWLPDLTGWAELVARYLRPGGTFYMVEFHPVAVMLSDDAERLEHPYFYTPEPDAYPTQGSYADPSAEVEATAYEWAHPIGTVVTALAAAGLRIERLDEYPYSPYDCFPFLKADGPGRYVTNTPTPLPLLYALRATRP